MPPPLTPVWVGLLRFATFETFPKERNLYATKLAIDGFRYCQSEDCLSCDFCTGHFVDWTSGFLGAHLAHASQCSMLKKDIPKDFAKEEKEIQKVDIAKVDNEKEDILKNDLEDTPTEDTPKQDFRSNLGNESAQASILPNEDVLSNASSDQIKNISEEEDERERFCLPDEMSNLEQNGINNAPLSLPSVSAETQKPEGEEVGDQVHTEQPTSFEPMDDEDDGDDENEPIPQLLISNVTEGVPKEEEKNILPSATASQPMEQKHSAIQQKHGKANEWLNINLDKKTKQKKDKANDMMKTLKANLDRLPLRRKDETDSKKTAIDFIMQYFYPIHMPKSILSVYPLLLDIQDQLYDESYYLESLRYGSFSKYRGMMTAGVPRRWFLKAAQNGFFVPPDDPARVVCFACGDQYPAHSLLCRRQVENLQFCFEPIPSLRLGDDAVVDTAEVLNVLIRPLQFRGWGYSTRVVDLHQDRRTGVTTAGLPTAAPTPPVTSPPATTPSPPFMTSSRPQQPVAPERSQCDICHESVNRRGFLLCCNLLWCLRCLLAKRICPACNNQFHIMS